MVLSELIKRYCLCYVLRKGLIAALYCYENILGRSLGRFYKILDKLFFLVDKFSLDY